MISWKDLLSAGVLLATAPGAAMAASVEVPQSARLDKQFPDRATLLPMITREALAQGIPPAIADAVVRVESGYHRSAMGDVGEVGLMQIRPATASMLGFSGPLSQLAEPETNIHFGVAYLAGAWRLSGGDLCRALMKYRAGHGNETMTPLSVDYCRRARVHLNAADPESLASLPAPVKASVVPAAPRPVVVAANARPPAAALVSGPRVVLVRAGCFPSAYMVCVAAR